MGEGRRTREEEGKKRHVIFAYAKHEDGPGWLALKVTGSRPGVRPVREGGEPPLTISHAPPPPHHIWTLTPSVPFYSQPPVNFKRAFPPPSLESLSRTMTRVL